MGANDATRQHQGVTMKARELRRALTRMVFHSLQRRPADEPVDELDDVFESLLYLLDRAALAS